jgi:anion-transporting  ArsA/GET3 family ATPase
MESSVDFLPRPIHLAGAVKKRWLDELLRRRLLMVTGKGGTGKSTCASAIAVLAARRGLRPLLVEVESNSTARSIFGVKRTALLPKGTAAGVDVASVGFQTGIEELVHDVMGVPRVVKVLLRHPVISRFLRATPSALDFIALFLTHRYLGGVDSRGEPEHPLVVVDMPAFGHARQMLSVGRNVADLLRVGPLATRGTRIDEMVHDAESAAVIVVTLPEEMPVTETVEGYRALRDELGVPIGPVLVNCTHPERFDRPEAALVSTMAAAAEAGGDAVSAHALRHAAERAQWAAERRARIELLRQELPTAQLVKVPLFAGAVTGMTLTESVAQALETAEAEDSREPN